ncbi:hypothetical protein BDN71DRAFT_1511669 [Pleurotus eryngii]|uniref:Uncharacterized protein n=1 Tax=Pleurotus eryngii TaxID=5323 RepID=A0A9P6D2H3_PLEER|nr:hypothetical protein BDN71DRAFT_1511669 [Pleurotus eryngii]
MATSDDKYPPPLKLAPADLEDDEEVDQGHPSKEEMDSRDTREEAIASYADIPKRPDGTIDNGSAYTLPVV